MALKTLIVIHRTLREGDPTFREELVNFSQRGRILQLSNFKDDSSPIGEFEHPYYLFFLFCLSLPSYQQNYVYNFTFIYVSFFPRFVAWDCSAWVRTYALFLEERLECFRVLKYDIEAERLPRPAQAQEKVLNYFPYEL